jgi:hypothetical protein
MRACRGGQRGDLDARVVVVELAVHAQPWLSNEVADASPMPTRKGLPGMAQVKAATGWDGENEL